MNGCFISRSRTISFSAWRAAFRSTHTTCLSTYERKLRRSITTNAEPYPPLASISRTSYRDEMRSYDASSCSRSARDAFSACDTRTDAALRDLRTQASQMRLYVSCLLIREPNVNLRPSFISTATAFGTNLAVFLRLTSLTSARSITSYDARSKINVWTPPEKK